MLEKLECAAPMRPICFKTEEAGTHELLAGTRTGYFSLLRINRVELQRMP